MYRISDASCTCCVLQLPRQPKRAATKRTYKVSDSDEEDGEQGDGDSDGDAAAEEAGPSSKAGTGSKRAAAGQGGKARGASAGALLALPSRPGLTWCVCHAA